MVCNKIVSGILHFIISNFGLINLLIYGAYIKKWWQNIIESIFCLNSYMVADGAGEIFFHVRWRNWACTAQEFGSARQTSKRSTQRCWLFLWRLRIDTVTVKLRVFLMCLAYSFKKSIYKRSGNHFANQVARNFSFIYRDSIHHVTQKKQSLEHAAVARNQ